jgi:hypothetical protein
VLTGTALALGTAAIPVTVSQTVAQVKISQATARYHGTPKGDQRCEGCANFQPPNACKFVEGHIAPKGVMSAVCQENVDDGTCAAKATSSHSPNDVVGVPAFGGGLPPEARAYFIAGGIGT